MCVVQMSEALEAKAESHMHESVQSAQAAADAEARAASMHDAMMCALREQQAAEARSALLESKIREEVTLRLRAVGADRTLWPQVRSPCDMHAVQLLVDAPYFNNLRRYVGHLPHSIATHMQRPDTFVHATMRTLGSSHMHSCVLQPEEG